MGLFSKFLSDLFKIDISRWYQRTYDGGGSPVSPKPLVSKDLGHIPLLITFL